MITENFKFVPSFSDPSITSRTIRLYHRKKSVSKALVTFVDDMKLMLKMTDDAKKQEVESAESQMAGGTGGTPSGVGSNPDGGGVSSLGESTGAISGSSG